MTTLEVMAGLFVFVVGLVALWALIAFIVDVTQTKQAIRRNYPVIGRFRARVVQPNGLTVALNEMYPDVPPRRRELEAMCRERA